jgi:hypothetical protein
VYHNNGQWGLHENLAYIRVYKECKALYFHFCTASRTNQQKQSQASTVAAHMLEKASKAEQCIAKLKQTDTTTRRGDRVGKQQNTLHRPQMDQSA